MVGSYGDLGCHMKTRFLFYIALFYDIWGLVLFLTLSYFFYHSIMLGFITHAFIGGAFYGLVRKSILVAFNGIGLGIGFLLAFQPTIDINFLLFGGVILCLLLVIYWNFQQEFNDWYKEHVIF